MMQNDFIKLTPSGLHCAAGNFFLDPKRFADVALVTHAHSDHAVPGSKKIYCTSPTRLLMMTRYERMREEQFRIVEYGEKMFFNDVVVTFFPAGHMLGSAMILAEYEGKKFLYTGDYKLQPDDSCDAVEFVEADVLITETTFAHPLYKHPDPADEIKKLNVLNGANIMIGAYSMGKAQRIMKLLQQNCAEKKIFVHEDIAVFNRVYEKSGIDLGSWEIFNRQHLKLQSNAAFIVPPNYLFQFKKNPELHRVFATGWKHAHKKFSSSLLISDHVDWNDLLTMIERTNPQTILTLHGDGTQLKKHFQNKIEVQIMNHGNRKKSEEYMQLSLFE